MSDNPQSQITPEEKAYYLFNKRVWNILAPFYNAIVLSLSKLRDNVVAFADPKDGSTILDAATGTGKQAFAFAKKNHEVTAVDMSKAMLNIALKKSKNLKINFGLADTTNMPFKKSSFDVSCVSFALHEMPLSIRLKTLKELARVTAPDGLIIVVDYALPEHRLDRFLVYNFIRLYEGRSYSNFVKSDLGSLLNVSGLRIMESCFVLLGAVRITKCTQE